MDWFFRETAKHLKGCMSKNPKVCKCAMRLMIVFLNSCGWYVTNNELLLWVPPDYDMDIFIFKICFNIAMLLVFASYFTASLRSYAKIPDMNWKISRMSSYEKDKFVCNHCRTFKPRRTHHCRQCGVCVPKMDHHCPWIASCVGYHNIKPFFLFCFYEVVVGSAYLAVVVMRAMHRDPKDEQSELSAFGVMCYWVMNLIDMPIYLGLLGLCPAQFL